mmetsp:Transcript_115273/g.358040  ORF Transcript_115273/g.358040 Transcript_115273/m.358040 type:complete len:288 (+) Transcript_115273:622-1485(+)
MLRAAFSRSRSASRTVKSRVAARPAAVGPGFEGRAWGRAATRLGRERSSERLRCTAGCIRVARGGRHCTISSTSRVEQPESRAVSSKTLEERLARGPAGEAEAEAEARRSNREGAELQLLQAEEEQLQWHATERERRESLRQSMRQERLQQEEQKRVDGERLQTEGARAALEQEEKARQAEKQKVEQTRKEEQKRKELLGDFYRRHGFVDANTPKHACCTALATAYPLHIAAERPEVPIVELLLQEGAEVAQKNWSGKTAAELAQQKNRGGSHDAVLRLLACYVRPA